MCDQEYDELDLDFETAVETIKELLYCIEDQFDRRFDTRTLQYSKKAPNSIYPLVQQADRLRWLETKEIVIDYAVKWLHEMAEKYPELVPAPDRVPLDSQGGENAEKGADRD